MNRIFDLVPNMLRGIRFLSLLASIMVGVQVILLFVRGETFCLNQGCHVVEALTIIPPSFFNLLGLVYFQAVFWMSLVSGPGGRALLRLLLVGGLAAEGTLVGYQVFVAHSLCTYCLMVFSILLVLNALAGWRQLALGIGVVSAHLLMFSLLIFDPSQNGLGEMTLTHGTCAVRTCSDPVKRVYLLFSEDCPHCHNVIEALEGCSRCEFHFNPIGRIEHDVLPGLLKVADYSPEINRLTLKILGIDTIPVLIAEGGDGVTFIKGERNIIGYIQDNCFGVSDVLPLYGENPFTSDDDGVCSLEQDCDQPKEGHRWK